VGLKCKVIIEVKDKEKSEPLKYVVEKDLGTDWFGRFLRSLFSYVSTNGYAELTVTDETGASRTVRTSGTTLTSLFNNTSGREIGSRIKVGTNGSTASRTHYNLLGTIEGNQFVTASYVDGSGNVDLTTSFSWGVDKTIYEVGLFLQLGDSGNITRVVMLDRTVVPTGIYVQIGKTLTITYRISI